jgi:hypothetical protein
VKLLAKGISKGKLYGHAVAALPVYAGRFRRKADGRASKAFRFSLAEIARRYSKPPGRFLPDFCEGNWLVCSVFAGERALECPSPLDGPKKDQ